MRSAASALRLQVTPAFLLECASRPGGESHPVCFFRGAVRRRSKRRARRIEPRGERDGGAPHSRGARGAAVHRGRRRHRRSRSRWPRRLRVAPAPPRPRTRLSVRVVARCRSASLEAGRAEDRAARGARLRGPSLERGSRRRRAPREKGHRRSRSRPAGRFFRSRRDAGDAAQRASRWRSGDRAPHRFDGRCAPPPARSAGRALEDCRCVPLVAGVGFQGRTRSRGHRAPERAKFASIPVNLRASPRRVVFLFGVARVDTAERTTSRRVQGPVHVDPDAGAAPEGDAVRARGIDPHVGDPRRDRPLVRGPLVEGPRIDELGASGAARSRGAGAPGALRPAPSSTGRRPSWPSFAPHTRRARWFAASPGESALPEASAVPRMRPFPTSPRMAPLRDRPRTFASRHGAGSAPRRDGLPQDAVPAPNRPVSTGAFR